MSEPVYTDEELKKIDPPPITYEGKQYTAYEAQQQMRKMERVMRKQRDKCIAADAMGGKETFTAASIKLRRQKDIYEDFCKAADSYTEYERTFVSDFNRTLAGKSAYATRVWRQMNTNLIGLSTWDKNIVSSIADHFVGRYIQRKISIDDVKNALTNPLRECITSLPISPDS